MIFLVLVGLLLLNVLRLLILISIDSHHGSTMRHKWRVMVWVKIDYASLSRHFGRGRNAYFVRLYTSLRIAGLSCWPSLHFEIVLFERRLRDDSIMMFIVQKVCDLLSLVVLHHWQVIVILRREVGLTITVTIWRRILLVTLTIELLILLVKIIRVWLCLLLLEVLVLAVWVVSNFITVWPRSLELRDSCGIRYFVATLIKLLQCVFVKVLLLLLILFISSFIHHLLSLMNVKQLLLVFKVQLMLIAQLIVVIGVIPVQIRSWTIDGLAVLVEVLTTWKVR